MPRWCRLGPLTLALTLSLPVGGSAQSMVHVRAGATLATLGGSDAPSVDSRIGLDLGGAVTFDLTESLALQAGLSYVQKGANLPQGDIDLGIQIDYLDIPVLLRYVVPMGGSISPHILLGPAVSFKLGCSLQVSGEGAAGTLSCGEAGVPPVQSLDFGAMGGAGVDIATSESFRVTFDVLYNLGVRSIDDSPSSEDVRNRSWSFLAGVAVPIN